MMDYGLLCAMTCTRMGHHRAVPPFQLFQIRLVNSQGLTGPIPSVKEMKCRNKAINTHPNMFMYIMHIN